MSYNHIMINGNKLREVRIKKGWNLRDLGKATGLNYANISRIENGLGSPRPSTAKAITDALEVSFDEIFKIK